MSVLRKPAAADADEPTSVTSGLKPELAGMSVKQRLEKFKSDMETLPKNQRGLHIRKYFTQLEMSGMYQKLKGKIKQIGGTLADEWQANHEKKRQGFWKDHREAEHSWYSSMRSRRRV